MVGFAFVFRTRFRHTGQLYTGWAAFRVCESNQVFAQDPQWVCRQLRNVTGSKRISVQICPPAQSAHVGVSASGYLPHR